MASAAKKRRSVIIAMDGSDASMNAFNCEYHKIQYLPHCPSIKALSPLVVNNLIQYCKRNYMFFNIND